MSLQNWRRLIAGLALVILCIAAVHTVRWVWRDITYWSRSITVPYKTASLEECVGLVLPAWPDVSASFKERTITLSTPLQEGLIVKASAEPHVARIVVYGHSVSVSNLGPETEEEVARYLQKLGNAMAEKCGSDTVH